VDCDGCWREEIYEDARKRCITVRPPKERTIAPKRFRRIPETNKDGTGIIWRMDKDRCDVPLDINQVKRLAYDESQKFWEPPPPPPAPGQPPPPPPYHWSERAPGWVCTDKDGAQFWWWSQPESARTYLRMNGGGGITAELIEKVRQRYLLDITASGGVSQLDWVLHVYNKNPPSDWNPPPDWRTWLATYEMYLKSGKRTLAN
jgi:hypothetical protein